MPFHLEKGRGLMALEDLLNNPARASDLEEALLLMNVNPPDMAAVLKGAAAHNGDVSTITLMDQIAAAWFGPNAYWRNYAGRVSEIVHRSLMLAMEVAWGYNGTPTDFPPAKYREREIHLWWHCAQPWFESWVTWENPGGPVEILFATPAHDGGNVYLDLADAVVNNDAALALSVADCNPHREMVLVGQQLHQWKLVVTSLPTPPKGFPIPTLGQRFDDVSPVEAWTIPTHAGGMNPRSYWGGP
jgi:hypothetical protein